MLRCIGLHFNSRFDAYVTSDKLMFKISLVSDQRILTNNKNKSNWHKRGNRSWRLNNF